MEMKFTYKIKMNLFFECSKLILNISLILFFNGTFRLKMSQKRVLLLLGDTLVVIFGLNTTYSACIRKNPAIEFSFFKS
ncbi:hypothetical protein DKT75_11950 [Leucothrix arctica]|uniref:Uncharacterized protein n=1 Tax=Leucothrix arctica TaxID=1481894 RepID=A0A317CC98_9GAMM|nr:hypothetical protein DKT75_11950 [Leucothrix arctica]